MATVPTTAELKQHLYVEIDDDDTLIEAYLGAAKELLKQQTGADVDHATSPYENVMATQFLKLQVAHWYEQRLPYSTASMNAVPQSLQDLLRLIKAHYERTSGTTLEDCGC